MKDSVAGRVATQSVLYRDALCTPIRILERNTDAASWRHGQEGQTRSQKLEALGTPAGGIAHDFNNILPAINRNAILKAGIRTNDLVKRILGIQPATRREASGARPEGLETVLFDGRLAEGARIYKETVQQSESWYYPGSKRVQQ